MAALLNAWACRDRLVSAQGVTGEKPNVPKLLMHKLIRSVECPEGLGAVGFKFTRQHTYESMSEEFSVYRGFIYLNGDSWPDYRGTIGKFEKALVQG